MRTTGYESAVGHGWFKRGRYVCSSPSVWQSPKSNEEESQKYPTGTHPRNELKYLVLDLPDYFPHCTCSWLYFVGFFNPWYLSQWIRIGALWLSGFASPDKAELIFLGPRPSFTEMQQYRWPRLSLASFCFPIDSSGEKHLANYWLKVILNRARRSCSDLEERSHLFLQIPSPAPLYHFLD